MGGLGARAHLASGLLPGCGWPRCAWARPPAGLIWSPDILGLAVGFGYPWAYCRGVAACWLDMESLPSSVLLPGRGCSRFCCGGLGSCGVAVGAGCDPSCA